MGEGWSSAIPRHKSEGKLKVRQGKRKSKDEVIHYWAGQSLSRKYGLLLGHVECSTTSQLCWLFALSFLPWSVLIPPLPQVLPWGNHCVSELNWARLGRWCAVTPTPLAMTAVLPKPWGSGRQSAGEEMRWQRPQLCFYNHRNGASYGWTTAAGRPGRQLRLIGQ